MSPFLGHIAASSLVAACHFVKNSHNGRILGRGYNIVSPIKKDETSRWSASESDEEPSKFKSEDLRIPPNNRLEQLKRDRAGQWSIRINDQWRVCFRFADGQAQDVEIVDYH